MNWELQFVCENRLCNFVLYSYYFSGKLVCVKCGIELWEKSFQICDLGYAIIWIEHFSFYANLNLDWFWIVLTFSCALSCVNCGLELWYWFFMVLFWIKNSSVCVDLKSGLTSIVICNCSWELWLLIGILIQVKCGCELWLLHYQTMTYFRISFELRT